MGTLLGQEEGIKLKDAHRLNLGKREEIRGACPSAYIARPAPPVRETRISFNLIYTTARGRPAVSPLFSIGVNDLNRKVCYRGVPRGGPAIRDAGGGKVIRVTTPPGAKK